jgi:iron complex transport system ATP-binding protein
MLTAKNVSIALAGRSVLHDLTLTLAPGALTVLVGPNGAGKSTLLKALTGALVPDAGRVTLDGRRLDAWPRRTLARRRAVLAQSQHVAFPFTVFEVVALGQVSWALSRSAEIRRLVLECLAAVDLAGYEGRFYQQLSGGEQQRVNVARALCQIGGPEGGRDDPLPRWLFLDEPTQSLDLKHQLAVLDIARRHVAEGGGALAILHDLNLAALYADRLLMLDAGRLVGDGAPEAVLAEPLVQSVFGERLRVVADAAAGRRFIVPTGHAA